MPAQLQHLNTPTLRGPKPLQQLRRQGRERASLDLGESDVAVKRLALEVLD